MSVSDSVSVSGVNALTGIFVFICATNNKNVIKDAMQSATSIEWRIHELAMRYIDFQTCLVTAELNK